MTWYSSTKSNYNNRTTRGNNLRLQQTRTRYDLRKFFFTNRVVNIPVWKLEQSV